MSELKIVYLSPKELKPYENNTRKHSPIDIDGIKKSIQDVGFRDPIGIWGKENLIVEGHGRQLAAIELGMEKVPCIRLDDMTEEQRKEYSIRHNRSAEMSEWNFEKLEEELAALDIAGIDMSDLKFEVSAFDTEPVDLDDNGDAKNNVIVSINFQTVEDYENAKDELNRIADNNGASVAVKMA